VSLKPPFSSTTDLVTTRSDILGLLNNVEMIFNHFKIIHCGVYYLIFYIVSRMANVPLMKIQHTNYDS